MQCWLPVYIIILITYQAQNINNYNTNCYQNHFRTWRNEQIPLDRRFSYSPDWWARNTLRNPSWLSVVSRIWSRSVPAGAGSAPAGPRRTVGDRRTRTAPVLRVPMLSCFVSWVCRRPSARTFVSSPCLLQKGLNDMLFIGLCFGVYSFLRLGLNAMFIGFYFSVYCFLRMGLNAMLSIGFCFGVYCLFPAIGIECYAIYRVLFWCLLFPASGVECHVIYRVLL